MPPVAGTVQISPPETNAISLRSGDSDGSVKYGRGSAKATITLPTIERITNNNFNMSGASERKSVTQSALIRDPKGTHRKRAKLSHLHRHSEELETAIRQLAKTAEMLDDRNVVSEQNCMCWTITVARRVDIE